MSNDTSAEEGISDPDSSQKPEVCMSCQRPRTWGLGLGNTPGGHKMLLD